MSDPTTRPKPRQFTPEASTQSGRLRTVRMSVLDTGRHLQPAHAAMAAKFQEMVQLTRAARGQQALSAAATECLLTKCNDVLALCLADKQRAEQLVVEARKLDRMDLESLLGAIEVLGAAMLSDFLRLAVYMSHLGPVSGGLASGRTLSYPLAAVEASQEDVMGALEVLQALRAHHDCRDTVHASTSCRAALSHRGGLTKGCGAAAAAERVSPSSNGSGGCMPQPAQSFVLGRVQQQQKQKQHKQTGMESWYVEVPSPTVVARETETGMTANTPGQALVQGAGATAIDSDRQVISAATLRRSPSHHVVQHAAGSRSFRHHVSSISHNQQALQGGGQCSASCCGEAEEYARLVQQLLLPRANICSRNERDKKEPTEPAGRREESQERQISAAVGSGDGSCGPGNSDGPLPATAAESGSLPAGIVRGEPGDSGMEAAASGLVERSASSILRRRQWVQNGSREDSLADSPILLYSLKV